MGFDGLEQLFWLTFLILLNGFFAVVETSLTHSSRLRLRQLRSEGVHWAGLVEDLAQDSRSLLATVYLGTILVQLAMTASAVFTLVPSLSVWLSRVFPTPSIATLLSVVLIVLVLALVILVFGQLLPRSLALRNPEWVALRIAPVYRVVAWLLSPIVKGLMLLSPLAESLSGEDHPGAGCTLCDGGENQGVGGRIQERTRGLQENR